MQETQQARQNQLRLLDEAGWPVVVDNVIRGVCHDINGRVNSLSSLTYLLNSGGDWSRSSGVVEEELKKLEGLARILRVLPQEDSGPIPLALADSIPPIRDLVRIQPGLEGVELRLLLPLEFPAIRMDETVLNRCLLLLLTSAATEAGARGENQVEISGEPGSSVLWISPVRNRGSTEGATPQNPEGRNLPDNLEVLVGDVLRAVGGRLDPSETSGEEGGLEVGFPGLAG